jgi:RES domain-containing protein
MVVYRISRSKWANDLSGEGARLNGGRWNLKGTPCVYASASRALALLEYTVNTDVHDIPRSLSMVTLETPDDYLAFEVAELPGDWAESPVPFSTQNFGTMHLRKGRKAVYCLPSVIIPEEYNYLLNPAHPQHKEVRILEVKDFVYDIRIKDDGSL